MYEGKVTFAVVGLGGRASAYLAALREFYPDGHAVVAVADPDPKKRLRAAREYAVPESGLFETDLELMEQPRLADVAIVGTQDALHYRETVALLEKGYDNTTIQDIVNELDGLSKGAVYHHFKSKEEILMAVTDRMTEESNRTLMEIRDRQDLNGKEKLKTIFKASICRPVQNDIFTVAPNFSNNPKLLFSLLSDTIEEVAPNYILPIIEQGILDGSIRTEYPKQLAELIILVANIWMNPMIFGNTEEETYSKFMVFSEMMRGFGLDIMDEEMIERIQELTTIYQKNK